MRQTIGGIITKESKMAEILLQNHHLILMMEHLGMDLAVQDNTVAEVCAANKINPDVFLSFANQYMGYSYKPEKELSDKDISVIIAFLQRCHSYYLNEKCPAIHNYIKEMGEVNGSGSVAMLEKFFNEYVAELKDHLEYEEQTVFPYVNKLNKRILKNEATAFESSFSVDEYKNHHDDVNSKLDDLKNLLIRYLPEKKGRSIRRRLLFTLFEFEYDLEIHSKVEDFILIPLVEAMEKRLVEFK